MKIPRIDGFSRVPEMDFRYETKARKVMVDIQICCSIQLSHHKEPPEVGLVKKVNWKFVLVGGRARANPTYRTL